MQLLNYHKFARERVRHIKVEDIDDVIPVCTTSVVI